MVSPLGKAIEFFKDFGLFDIVIPFLLVFTLVYAILEKTKLLGTQKIDKEVYANKNLNSMIAFAVGLLVVASANVVRTINHALPNIIVLSVASLCFLILVGLFVKEGDFDFSEKHKYWYGAFVVIMFLGVILIFLNSIYIGDSEDTWLSYAWNYVMSYWSGTVVSSIIMVIVIIGAILYATGTFGKGAKKEEKK